MISVVTSISPGFKSRRDMRLVEEIVMNKDNPPSLLAMHTSNFCFYLTGSRFFGNSKESSDFDFITPEGDDVKAFLEGLGFFKEGNHRYTSDHVTTAVYRNYRVDVQLVYPKKVVDKLALQNLFRMLGIHSPNRMQWYRGLDTMADYRQAIE